MPKAVEIDGKILAITKEEEGKGGYKCKRIVVLEPNPTNEKYDNMWNIQVGTDKYSLLDKFTPGSHVKVFFNTSSKKWVNTTTNKVSYFVTNTLWKIESQGAETHDPHAQQQAESVGFSQTSSEDDGRDLPF